MGQHRTIAELRSWTTVQAIGSETYSFPTTCSCRLSSVAAHTTQSADPEPYGRLTQRPEPFGHVFGGA
jgi:hypothetical protein